MDIKKISMIELLEKFKESDTFSLTGSIDGVLVTEEDKNKALDEIIALEREYLLKHYNLLKEEYSFIPFDELYNEIEEETKRNREKYNEETEEIYIRKEMKYNDPYWYFWHFYSCFDRNCERSVYVDKLINMNNKLSAVDKIRDDILKSNLIRYDISFCSHSTESAGLMINYYFKLNDDTKKWLLQFESDFDLEELNDLAFYKDGKLLFSSCTVEETNSLLD